MAKWPYNTEAWRRLRALKLNAEPLCEYCARRGDAVRAEQVDHRIPISEGGAPFPALAGLLSLCATCHSQKTRAEARQKHLAPQDRLLVKGCDARGRPVDPAHPWNGGRGGQGRLQRGPGPSRASRTDLITNWKL